MDITGIVTEEMIQLINKDKERRRKQLLRVERWMEAHPEQHKERRKLYAKTYRDKKKSELKTTEN